MRHVQPAHTCRSIKHHSASRECRCCSPLRPVAAGWRSHATMPGNHTGRGMFSAARRAQRGSRRCSVAPSAARHGPSRGSTPHQRRADAAPSDFGPDGHLLSPRSAQHGAMASIRVQALRWVHSRRARTCIATGGAAASPCLPGCGPRSIARVAAHACGRPPKTVSRARANLQLDGRQAQHHEGVNRLPMTRRPVTTRTRVSRWPRHQPHPALCPARKRDTVHTLQRDGIGWCAATADAFVKGQAALERATAGPILLMLGISLAPPRRDPRMYEPRGGS